MSNQFCNKCGSTLEPGATYCLRCGAFVGQQAQQPLTPTYSQPFQYTPPVLVKKTPKIDIKKTILSNIIPVVCLGVGVVLLVAGLGVSIPSSYISSYSMTEYVGGDAYNFIVEAALRGGKIAGATVTKSLYTAGGLLIACISALKIKLVKPEKENNEGESK